LGNAYLDRAEVVDLLKELITSGIIQPTLVSIEKNKQGTFILTLNTNGNLPELRAFLIPKNLVYSEDREKGICTINKVSK
jgi:hypothetical protein